MPVSQLECAKRLIAEEKHLGADELIKRWTGRSESAYAWYLECETQLMHLAHRSQLEMNIVVEATAPPKGGS